MGVRKNVLFNDYKKEHHSVTVYRSGVFEVNTTPLISTPCQDHDILFEIKTHLILYLKVLPLVSLSCLATVTLIKVPHVYNGVTNRSGLKETLI